MRIGFSLLNNWGIEDVQALVGLAVRAEELGIDSDEAIAVMRTLWSEEDPRFDGVYSSFAGMKFSPKPVQQPIPIVIGGVSRAAIRRAARIGDGWQPLGLSPEALELGIATLREEAQAYGRDPAQVPVSI